MRNAIESHKFPIGTKFTPIGKNKKDHFVVEHLTVTDSSGEVVGCHYECEHEFLGQRIRSILPSATIARGNPVLPPKCFAR